MKISVSNFAPPKESRLRALVYLALGHNAENRTGYFDLTNQVYQIYCPRCGAKVLAL